MVGFWGKTQHFMHERLQLPGPHKEFTCFPTIPHQKLSNQCIFQALCSYILEILPFLYKSGSRATLLRVFGEISLISPQKS